MATKLGLSALGMALAFSGCAMSTVDTAAVQRGSADGMSFRVQAPAVYDHVWDAALKAMSQDMAVVEQHKPSGTIRARTGSGPSGKVVALFISPTDARAPFYTVELVARAPVGFGLPEQRHPEYAAVAAAFSAAMAGARR